MNKVSMLKFEINYLLLIFCSILLIFFDAYEIYSIPISWLGMSLLFVVSLLETRLFFNKKKYNATILIITIILIPQITYLLFFQGALSDIIYIGLRIFNIVSFIFVLFFSIYFFQDKNIEIFIKYLRYFIYFFSTATIYIFVAQIFDFYEPFRNRSNTNLYGEAIQSTFWLSQPHRAMGTFREPVFLVSFFFPIVILFLYYSKEKYLTASILSGVALGLTRSNLLILFSIIFISFFIFQLLIEKKLKLQFFIFFTLIFMLSIFGVFECNLNPDSNECLDHKEVVSKINNSGEIKIDTNIDEPIVELGNDRFNVLKYFINSIKFINAQSFNNVNDNYQTYSTLKVNEEMYFSNRTLPRYLLQRYSTKNFGTGNYSVIEYSINVQNMVVFYTLSFGVLFPLLLFLFFIYFITTKKINFESILFLLLILFFFTTPIEEVNSYFALIIGFTYNLFVKEKRKYEKI